MRSRQLLTGSTLPTLDSHAFTRLTEEIDTHPEAVLYLSQQDHPRDSTRDRWDAVGSPATLRIDTLDGLVADCYERDQYKGRVTHIDRPLLFRLVELGVEHIDSPTNPLGTGDQFPQAGLVDKAETLFTELEFAGLLSPEGMYERLEAEGLADHATHVKDFATGVRSARTEILADELPDTYRTERMAQVIESETSLRDLFPAVEAVVLSGFTRFDALEQRFLKELVAEWPTIALLPMQTDTEGADGLDTGVERALDTYTDLGLTREHLDGPDSTTTPRTQIAASLYRHPDSTPRTADIETSTLDITYAEPDTPVDEVRDTARAIRARIAEVTSPSEITVALTSPSQYADHLQEVFNQYDVPYHLETDLPLSETALGHAVGTVCRLAEEPRSVETLLNLLTNPLVTVAEQDGALDHQELARVAGQVETTNLQTTLSHLDGANDAAVNSLVRDMAALQETTLTALPGQLDALFERLGVSETLSHGEALTDTRQSQEQAARERLERVLETLALTDPVANLDLGTSVDRLERAMAGVSVQTRSHAPAEHVTVCGLSEALYHDVEQVYLLGLTNAQFPSNPDRLAFMQPIYDADPDFEQRDVAAEARYHAGAILSSDASLHLSVPQRSLDGEPFVEADFITELRRLVDLDDLSIEPPIAGPGSQEDIQRGLGEFLAATDVETTTPLVGEATSAGTFTEAERERLHHGMACAEARASPKLTDYDGRLTPETVAQVHTEADRTPYSPSRLETYAACGFKYYMRRVLDIEAPDPLTREPDAGARGSFIHDVLEHYYLAVQDETGKPTTCDGPSDDRQHQLLTIALERLDTAFDQYPETAFQDAWLRRVLAGLGTPAENPFYGPDATMADHEPLARGLFYRFLQHEGEGPGKTTARPTWFEGRVGEPYRTGTPLSEMPADIDTPAGTVSIHGIIDRIDTVPGAQPTQAVVRDYKTGNSTPSANEALLGLRFQLPLYALMAEDALAATETVGAAYYQVSPPTSVNSRKGLITSQEMATWQGADEVDTPLLRRSHPHFETHEAFRRFVDETTPKRLGTIAAGIREGSFHPTLLDPGDAGCRYCDYAAVCDVRSHQRREIMDNLEGTKPVYLPPIAHDLEPEEAVEVN